MLGLELFSWWLRPFITFIHFQFCSTVKMVRFKQLYCCYIFFLDCSLAPGLFLIFFLGLYSTLKVSAVFSLNGLCSFLLCWTDQRLFFPGTSPILSTTSALTMESIEVTVGIAGSYAVTAITLSSLFYWFTAAKRHPGEVWCLCKARLAIPAQPLGNAGHHFCSVICHKQCHKIVYKTSYLVNGWSHYIIDA